MVDVKDAFIGEKEISQVLGIGMTKAYAIIKAYNKELDDKGYFTIRGKCPRKYFEQKIYGYEDLCNLKSGFREKSIVAEESDEYATEENPSE